jgi:hypothetical protein
LLKIYKNVFLNLIYHKTNRQTILSTNSGFINDKVTHSWNFTFMKNRKNAWFFSLSFDTHIRSFPVIWKSRISKNFEKNLEKFSKIFNNIFFNFFIKKYQEWLPRIFLSALSLDFGLDRWQPRLYFQKCNDILKKR